MQGADDLVQLVTGGVHRDDPGPGHAGDQGTGGGALRPHLDRAGDVATGLGEAGTQGEHGVAGLLLVGDQLEQAAVEVAPRPLAQHVGLLPGALGTTQHARPVLDGVLDAIALVGHHQADPARGAERTDQAGHAGRGDDEEVRATLEKSGRRVQQGGPERRRAPGRDHGVEVAGPVEPEPQPVEQQGAATGSVDGIGDEHAHVQRATRGVGPRQQVTSGRDETEDDRCDVAQHPRASR